MTKQKNSTVLHEIIDIEKFKDLFRGFYELTGLAVSINMIDGEEILSIGNDEVCQKFYKKHPETLKNCKESIRYVNPDTKKGSYCTFKCKNGLKFAGVPLKVDDQHIANIYFGEFFRSNEKPDMEFFSKQADKYGFDKDNFLKAVNKVKILSKKDVTGIMRFYQSLSDILADLGQKNKGLREQAKSREKVEKKLRKQSGYLESIYYGSGASLFIIDVREDGQFVFRGLNPAHEKASGMKSKDVEGKTVDELYPMIPREALEVIKGNYQRCVDAGDIIEYEEMIPMMGKEIWWSTRLTPLKDENGRIWRIIGSAMPVTRLKETEKRLQEYGETLKDNVKEKTEELNAVVNSIPGLFYVYDDKGNLIRYNDNFSKITGYTKKELDRINALDFFDGTDKQLIADAMKEVFVKGSSSAEAQLVTKNNKKIHFYFTGERIILDGKAYLVGHGSDITTIKKAREELEQSEKRFKSFFNLNPDPIFLADPQTGRIIECNVAASELIGRPVKEIAGMHQKDLHPADEQKAIAKKFAQIARRGSRKTQVVNVINSHGRIIPVEVLGAVILIDNKPVALGIFRDISERIRYDNRLKQLITDLEKSNKELEQFAYVASHDLQEPLRMVTSFLQLIERRYSDKIDREGKEFIDYAVDGANRMKQLIGDLLKFSRLGTRAKDFEKTDLNKTLSTVLNTLDQDIREYKVKVKNNNLPVLNVDKTQIEQLFQNLLTNSIKFRSDTQPVIEINCKELKNHWKFTFTDNGVGINPEYKDRVFEMFERLNAKSEYSGTGMGLAICKKIVERHRGEIKLDIQKKNGSKFIFTINKNLTNNNNNGKK